LQIGTKTPDHKSRQLVSYAQKSSGVKDVHITLIYCMTAVVDPLLHSMPNKGYLAYFDATS